ncbi:TRAP transporter large permease subunit [Advenella alkanexedens]|uniref:TRAP transporter large permease protein n=1 Tax=Advenella alkanexedens TaxID=1481665 RepID=A0ABS6NLT6_9BURK|nr:TRAP transporter large permease subunit [Advenella alkanexedens]MBV4396591.1 TRAP transporter large permease subunit [Advenella alkanexedens]
MELKLYASQERKRLVLNGSGQWVDRFSVTGVIVSLVALVFLSVVTLTDISLRSLSSHGVRGLFELNGLIMAVIISGFLSLVFIQRRNIQVDVMGKMAGSNQLGVALVSALAEAVMMIGLSWVVCLRAWDAYQYNETTVVTGMGTTGFWIVTSVVMIFGTLLVVGRNLAQWGRLILTKAYLEEGFLRGLGVVVAAFAISAVLLFVFLTPEYGMGLQASIVFIALYILIAAQIPVGVALALLGVTSLGLLLNVESAFVITQNEVARALTSMDLAAIPLFLLMGNFATWAGLSGDIFKVGTSLVGSRRGGLAMASVMGCGGFGAICGSSIATTATFGKVAFTEMEKRNYAHSLTAGCIAAGGTLGALLPPSVVLIVYCVVVEVSIRDAFQAALLPGLLALGMYIIAIMVAVRVKPDLAPTIEKFDWATARKALIQAWRPTILFLLVLGGLYGGFFTTQEAASVGAVLALAFAFMSKDFGWKEFRSSLLDTAINSGAIYIIFIGANIFAGFMSFSDVASLILNLVNVDVTPHWVILLALVVFYLLLGTIFDTMAAVLVTAPLVVPLILGMDYSLVWWGVVTLSLVEIGMITPPLGMNVFVMRSVVGDRLQLTSIFKGVTPFLLADLVRIALLVAFPAISMWLPSVLN